MIADHRSKAAILIRNPHDPTRIRILLVIPGPLNRMTGGSVYDNRVYEYLRERGARVDVVSLPDLPYFASLICGLILSPLFALRAGRRAYDLIIEDGWAHPSLFLFNLFCRVTSVYKIAIIVHQLRWPERRYRAGTAVARCVERSALKSARLVFTVSLFMRREIIKLIGDERPVMIASPGCDSRRDPGPGGSSPPESSTTAFAPGGQSRPPLRLLFVGNCARRKGLRYLIGALSIIDDPTIKLDVVGDSEFDPPHAEELRREVARLKLDEAVTFHGVVTDESLSCFYAQADLFVMPSSYEGFGIVYAEAMRAGLPIIACDTGPAAEIVSAGENALLVPCGDTEALADAIRTLAADRGMRMLYGLRSIELARRLPTWDDTCSLLFQNLSALICAQESYD
jgi:glycosyltransferase involved in cell wall biosynthesis